MAQVTMSANEAIREVFSTYESALNTASTSLAVSCYAPDGVCMPQHGETAIGRMALEEAYNGFFAALSFDVKFEVQEIQILTEEWAFARTSSQGSAELKTQHGAKRSEKNQELFLMQNVKGIWKIARYCFCTMNPPPKT